MTGSVSRVIQCQGTITLLACHEAPCRGCQEASKMAHLDILMVLTTDIKGLTTIVKWYLSRGYSVHAFGGAVILGEVNTKITPNQYLTETPNNLNHQSHQSHQSQKIPHHQSVKPNKLAALDKRTALAHNLACIANTLMGENSTIWLRIRSQKNRRLRQQHLALMSF